MSKDGYFSRKKEVAPLESAFNDLLKAYRLEGKFREKSLIHDWPELVGKLSQTGPLQFSSKTKSYLLS